MDLDEEFTRYAETAYGKDWDMEMSLVRQSQIFRDFSAGVAIGMFLMSQNSNVFMSEFLEDLGKTIDRRGDEKKFS